MNKAAVVGREQAKGLTGAAGSQFQQEGLGGVVVVVEDKGPAVSRTG